MSMLLAVVGSRIGFLEYSYSYGANESRGEDSASLYGELGSLM